MESLSLGRPNLEEFAQTLLALASQNTDILVVTGDSRGSGKLMPFSEALPGQIVEIGIAEQNLVGISAGLASAGKKVFAVSPACFLTARSLEQIKNDVAYSDNPVKLIGISAGVSYGALGSTHHSIHDYAVLKAINNIDIVAPADNFETRNAIKVAVNHPRPIYIRMGKKPMYDLHTPDTRFEVGKAIVLSEGSDITFLATGEPLSRAVMAAHLLRQEGLSVGVISVHSLRPFDEETILHAAERTRVIVSVEEHSVYGGLGSMVASLLIQNGHCPKLQIVGIPDEYTVTGSQEEIFSYYGITPEGLAETARQILNTEED
jgi:transketolase